MTTPPGAPERMKRALIALRLEVHGDIVDYLEATFTAALAQAVQAAEDQWRGMVTDVYQPHSCGQGVTETCQACWDRERLFIALRARPAEPMGEKG